MKDNKLIDDRKRHAAKNSSKAVIKLDSPEEAGSFNVLKTGSVSELSSVRSLKSNKSKTVKSAGGQKVNTESNLLIE